MAYTVAWNAATPVGSSTNANTIDDELRNLKTSIQERMNQILENDWETDGDDPKTVSVGSLAGTPSCAVVTITSGVTIATSTVVVVPWTAETIDTAAYHDNSTNPSRLTISAAGYYRVGFNLGVISNSTAGILTLRLLKNGAELHAYIHKINNATEVENYAHEVIVLAAANDFYEVQVAHNQGDSWTVRGAKPESYFMIEKLNGTT